MYAFHNSDEFGMAAHARSLATLRGHTTDQVGLIGLATEVLSQARPSAFIDADELLGRVLANFEGEVWDNPATDVCADPMQAITAVPLDTATLTGAMKVLNRTELSRTLRCTEEAEEDLVMLMLSILVALYLTLDIKPRSAIAQLSDGRVTTPTSGLLGPEELWVLRYWTYGRMPTLRMGSKADTLRELVIHARLNWHTAVGKDGRGAPLTPPADYQEAIDAFFGPLTDDRGYHLAPLLSDNDQADQPF